MKKLFIVRHAKSSWDSLELDDYDRPLNKRGKKNAPEMGMRLAKRLVKPDMIITSSAKRAAATARRIAEEISFPVKNINKESQFYHGSVGDMISIMQGVSSDVNTLMVFGHNPTLTDLTNYLSGSDIYNIPTCGVAEMEFDVSSWDKIGKKSASLISFDYPKKNQTSFG